MKVLLVTGSYPPMRCGVGDYTERLANSLIEYTGIEVSVLTSVLGKGEASGAKHPEAQYVMPTWSRPGLRTFYSVVRRIRPDIVHIQFPTQGYVAAVNALSWIPLLCRLIFRIPVVLTWHEYVPKSEPAILRCMYAMALGASVLIVVRPNYISKAPALMRMALALTAYRLIPNVSNVPSVTLGEEDRAALRRELGCGESRTIAHFGFVYPHKGIESMFDMADPGKHHLLIIGELSKSCPYHAGLLERAASPPWRGRVTVTGFIPPAAAARLLALADAVVFPYVGGGGDWNTSVHGARCQGTFVLMTSTEHHGYDPVKNIFYTRPGAINEMRQALEKYAGARIRPQETAEQTWRNMAEAHQECYRSLHARRARANP